MLDRTIPPQPGPLVHRPLPAFEHTGLNNGIPVFLLPYGTVEMAEVQVVFKAGKAFQSKVGLASYTARMLSEGTEQYTSQQLAERLDEHGSWIHHDMGAEFVAVNLTSLVEDLPNTLPFLAEVLMKPTFPEEEFTKLMQRSMQSLQVQQEKTAPIARRTFGHKLYGESHPYGMNLGPDELALLKLDDLKAYYQSNLQSGNCFITVTGRFDRKVIMEQLESVFADWTWKDAPNISSNADIIPLGEQGFVHVHREGPQSTVRVGHLGVGRNDPDYYGLEVLTTALGGYFGSRLMKNIREEKGYTYGIYGAWAANRNYGHFVAQADVANEYVEDTLAQIKLEMKRLQDKPLEAQELALLQNYMLGKGLRARETPFQLSETLRHSLVYGIPFAEMDRGFEVIQHITADEIRDLAQKHFKPDDMLEVVVGGEQKTDS
ncbi:MAG: M16 family metallopeptidase [Bacteroidia bacterium]